MWAVMTQGLQTRLETVFDRDVDLPVIAADDCSRFVGGQFLDCHFLRENVRQSTVILFYFFKLSFCVRLACFLNQRAREQRGGGWLHCTRIVYSHVIGWVDPGVIDHTGGAILTKQDRSRLLSKYLARKEFSQNHGNFEINVITCYKFKSHLYLLIQYLYFTYYTWISE